MSRQLYTDFWNLLNDTEDFLIDGYRREHPRSEIPRAGVSGRETRPDTVESIADEISACTRCRLHEQRIHTVPGYGVPRPLVMFIGEGPGAEEDKSGRPFVGKAGQYLDKWLDAIGLSRDTNCFIGNIVKCRPPGNRDPLPDESQMCLPYLIRQIAVIKPKLIVTLGRVASQILIGTPDSLGKLRGGTYEFNGIPLIPTYHPSGVLRNQDLRRPVWDDLRRVQAVLNGG